MPRTSNSIEVDESTQTSDLTVSSPVLNGTTSSGAATVPRTSREREQNHVRYALNVDTQVPRQSNSRRSPLTATSPPLRGPTRSDTELSRASVRRRNVRASTFKTIKETDLDDLTEPGWHAGAEPGVDTSKPNGGHAVMGLHAECQITIVDFSQDDLEIHEMGNDQLIDFVTKPQAEWVKCRWINVNGLSWDVIQALGNYKSLHSLAVEDIMNTRNRTKVDWYQHHAFLVLTCQKLVQMIDPDTSDDEDDLFDAYSMKSHSSMQGLKKKMKRWWWSSSRKKDDLGNAVANTLEGGSSIPPLNDILEHQATGLSDVFNPSTLTTLQRYRASSNEARNDFMERHSALASRGLAVAAEQVAMFITSDNTVIAFFEQSADDVEKPILSRLASPDTILRQSCDASMVGQAIIDAIIDMAIPVASCYADAIADLELDVLLRPSIKQTRSLYIIQSEINKMAGFINPIASIISAMRDHKTTLSQTDATKELQNPHGGVIITPMTHTYLGDVYDHCLLIAENLMTIRKSADGMIDLIFNTISAYQNESMKQLTVITIIFLPLTFLSGYFGQNFTGFDAIEGSVLLFWKIAIPVTFGIIVVLMRQVVFEWVRSLFQRRKVWTVRKRRKDRLDRVRAQRKLVATRTW
ncbi:putative Magnesium transport protein CorA [Seiridium cardinale]|uniref:Magnesium transport protein CorA n=1 Tax=Seiridium cardinale TaxID=138064 RepID=A0ABR2XMY7_9PEZI